MLNELWRMTAHQVKEGHFKKAVLAVGACEAHGQHLAEGCDTIVSYKLGKAIADELGDMLVLPPIPVGYSGHYDSFPFTLTLQYDTVTQVIYDIVESVLRNGIDTILIINGHDGNIAPIEVASRKIKEKYPSARIAALDQWWVTAGELLPKGTFEVLGMQVKARPQLPTICSPNGASQSRQPAAYRRISLSLWGSSGTSPSSPTRRRLVMRPRGQRRKAKRCSRC